MVSFKNDGKFYANGVFEKQTIALKKDQMAGIPKILED